jgi:hypothetical protein
VRGTTTRDTAKEKKPCLAHNDVYMGDVVSLSQNGLAT